MRPKLFVVPHAGGSSYSYYGVTKFNAEVILLDLAGHGTRLNEPLLDTLDDIVDDLYSSYFEQIVAEPFCLFGHSMGGVIGYLLSLKIFQRTSLLPNRLIISSIGPPPTLPLKQLHKLPDHEFIAAMRKYEGIPEEIIANKEMMNFFMPIIKNDFKAIETFNFTETQLPHIPTVLIWGCDDIIDKNTMVKWNHYTGNNTILREIKGGHFSIFENLNIIEEIVSHKYFEEVNAS